MDTIERLPYDVIKAIVYFLSVKPGSAAQPPTSPTLPVSLTPQRQDLIRLSCTCKRLRDILTTEIVFKVHFNTNYGEILHFVGNVPHGGAV